jgi:heme-degrading monooxygenase HmoA
MNELMEARGNADNEIEAESDAWKAGPTLEPYVRAGTAGLNARVVEFIAKPGRAKDLQDCIRESVVDYLKKRAGFAGTMVLTSHKELRLVLVFSFWSTERAATENRWEDSRIVRQAVNPLIDVCARVNTYTAAIPATPKMMVQVADLQVC